MKAEFIRLNGCYRLKDDVFAGCVQASGQPFTSPDVTIVRVKYPAGRKRAFYFDAAGNAFRSDDFSGFAPIIAVEIELGEHEEDIVEWDCHSVIAPDSPVEAELVPVPDDIPF